MRIAPVATRSRSLVSLVRFVALSLFAALLLARLGPFCEAAAQAAPVASAMAGCDGKTRKAPDKEAPGSACTTPCVAVRGDALARAAPALPPAIVPVAAPASGLVGLPVPPATPPPRLV